MICLRIIVLFLCCSISNADLITVDSFQNDYLISYNTPYGDGAGLVVGLTETADTMILQPITYTVGVLFAWYAVDSIDFPNYIGNLNPFAANWGTMSSIIIDKNTSFYLGSWSGNEYDSLLSKPILSTGDSFVYGEFVANNQGLNLISSSIVMVPEPTSLLMTIIGLCLILWKGK